MIFKIEVFSKYVKIYPKLSYTLTAMSKNKQVTIAFVSLEKKPNHSIPAKLSKAYKIKVIKTLNFAPGSMFKLNGVSRT